MLATVDGLGFVEAGVKSAPVKLGQVQNRRGHNVLVEFVYWSVPCSVDRHVPQALRAANG